MFNSTKLERARKRATSSSNRTASAGPIKMRRTSFEVRECFLCEKAAPESDLRQAMTMHLDDRLNECAKTLNDGKLLAILSAGDVVAQELKYHRSCLSTLYNRERACLASIDKDKDQTASHESIVPLVFSELLAYIVETKSSSDSPIVFRLADLVSLYKQRLQQLGLHNHDVNSTRLKDKLLAEIPELETHKKGRDVLLAFEEDVGSALSQASTYSEAIILAKAAKILRRHMIDHTSTFEGTFYEGCVEEAVPSTLIQFVGMIEHGADIKSQLRFGASKTDLAMAQLLQYNCYTKYKEGAVTHRHSKDRETPFPVFMGMSVYAKTRKRLLVELLHEHGLSIPYDRVLEISAQLGDASVNKYVEDGVVCPIILRKGLFTTAAMDNIDHNPTSTTASTSFHGTSISVFQHPTRNNQGELREPLQVKDSKAKTVPELPDSFTNIGPAFFTKKKPSPPAFDGLVVPDMGSLRLQLALEYEWLDKVSTTEELQGEDNLTWSAHHASKSRSKDFEVSIAPLLPLLRDPAHCVATVRHVMDKIRDIVSFLNPGQVPVLAADQPIYAVAKQIQWHWPQRYGEDKLVVMFGGLHIEMAALKSIGTLMKESGWTTALVDAGIASAGTADSFLVASSVTRTRQAHQITACSLYKLQKAAYTDYCSNSNDAQGVLTFDEWHAKCKLNSPQFQFWDLVLTMELTIFSLIRAFREADFGLYCQVLSELIPFFFANNNVNYARWLPVHLRDMVTLDQKNPQVAEEFKNGKFVVYKTIRAFSAMAIDQAHEQGNAVVKGDGGAVGLTEDPSALRRWMVAGPEVSHLVSQYEIASEAKDENEHGKHHEQTDRSQKVFFDRVQRLCAVMDDMGNPFQEESAELLTLDTKNIAHPTAAAMVSTHLEKGKVRFNEFMKELENQDCKFYEPIKRTKMDFFRQQSAIKDSKQKELKEDRQLFSKLFISCQSRECDLHEFFKHENQSFPAALSDSGKLHSCQKSQLAALLQAHVTLPDVEPQAEVIIIDGSAMVNALQPRNSATFEEYAAVVVVPAVQAYSAKYRRTDIVFDVYLSSSLKAETRSKRGSGVRRRVSDKGKIPPNWQSFLRDNDNKTELFNFLADKIVHRCRNDESIVIVTRENRALSNKEIGLDGVTPCNHEEADSRIFVHAKDAVLEGCKVLVIKASDTDVLVIAVNLMTVLQELGLERLWFAFGQGQNLRWIPVHDMKDSLGPERTQGILFFHTFTGCDVVSAFRGKGKKSAWQTWDVFPDVSHAFTRLSQYPATIEDEDIEVLQKFVILMYDRSSTASEVDDARLDMFARKQRPYEAIPPTLAALVEHIHRAAYQAGCIWGQAAVRQMEVQSPADWGWRTDGEHWKIFWTTLPPIAQSCQQLTKCGCKTSDCRGRCKCYRFGLACTALCSCRCDE